MSEFDQLIEGYHRFRSERFAQQNRLYRKLAERGQSPRVMVIGCCDSRADPALIFDTAPGEIFAVRNVANLVPPYLPNDDYHSTSAALEFAVTGLEVSHILVLGHARCGGIQASLKGSRPSSFIGKWMSILDGARQQVDAAHEGADEPVRQHALELAGIGQSLTNLMGYPFVSERVGKETLSLHGGYFDIASGILHLRAPETGAFAEVA